MAEPNDENQNLVADGTLGLAELTRNRENVTNTEPQLEARLARLEELQAVLQGRIEQVEAAQEKSDPRDRLDQIDKRLADLEFGHVLPNAAGSPSKETTAPKKPDHVPQMQQMLNLTETEIYSVSSRGENHKKMNDSQDIARTQDPDMQMQEVTRSPKERDGENTKQQIDEKHEISKNAPIKEDTEKQNAKEPQENLPHGGKTPKMERVMFEVQEEKPENVNINEIAIDQGSEIEKSDTLTVFSSDEDVKEQTLGQELPSDAPTEQDTKQTSLETHMIHDNLAEGEPQKHIAEKENIDVSREQQEEQNQVTTDTPSGEKEVVVEKLTDTLAEEEPQEHIPVDDIIKQTSEQETKQKPPTTDTLATQKEVAAEEVSDDTLAEVELQEHLTAENIHLSSEQQTEQNQVTTDTPDTQKEVASEELSVGLPIEQKDKQAPLEQPPIPETLEKGEPRELLPAEEAIELPTEQEATPKIQKPSPSPDTPEDAANEKTASGENEQGDVKGCCREADCAVVCSCRCNTMISATAETPSSPCGCSFPCPSVETLTVPKKETRRNRRASAPGPGATPRRTRTTSGLDPRNYVPCTLTCLPRRAPTEDDKKQAPSAQTKTRRSSADSLSSDTRKTYPPSASKCPPHCFNNMSQVITPYAADTQQQPPSFLGFPGQSAITPDVFRQGQCETRSPSSQPMTGSSGTVENNRQPLGQFGAPLQSLCTLDTVAFLKQLFSSMCAANQSGFPHQCSQEPARFRASMPQVTQESPHPSNQSPASTHPQYGPTQTWRPSVPTVGDSGYWTHHETQNNHVRPPSIPFARCKTSHSVSAAPPNVAGFSPSQDCSFASPIVESRTPRILASAGRRPSVPLFGSAPPLTPASATFEGSVEASTSRNRPSKTRAVDSGPRSASDLPSGTRSPSRTFTAATDRRPFAPSVESALPHSRTFASLTRSAPVPSPKDLPLMTPTANSGPQIPSAFTPGTMSPSRTLGGAGKSPSVPSFGSAPLPTPASASLEGPIAVPPPSTYNIPPVTHASESAPQVPSNFPPNAGRSYAPKLSMPCSEPLVKAEGSQISQDCGRTSYSKRSSRSSQIVGRSPSFSSFPTPQSPKSDSASPAFPSFSDRSRGTPNSPMNSPCATSSATSVPLTARDFSSYPTHSQEGPTRVCAPSTDRPREKLSVSTSFSNPMLNNPQYGTPEPYPLQGSPRVPPPHASEPSGCSTCHTIPSVPPLPSCPSFGTSSNPYLGAPSSLYVSSSDTHPPYPSVQTQPTGSGFSRSPRTPKDLPAPYALDPQGPSPAVPSAVSQPVMPLSRGVSSSMYRGRPSRGSRTSPEGSVPPVSQQGDRQMCDASAARSKRTDADRATNVAKSAALPLACPVTPASGREDSSRGPWAKKGGSSSSRKPRPSSRSAYVSTTIYRTISPVEGSPDAPSSAISGSNSSPRENQGQPAPPGHTTRSGKAQIPCDPICKSSSADTESPDTADGSAYPDGVCPSLGVPENHGPDGTFSCSHQCPAVAGTAPCPSLSRPVSPIPEESASPPVPDRFDPPVSNRCTHRDHVARPHSKCVHRKTRGSNNVNINTSSCKSEGQAQRSQGRYTPSKWRK